MILSSFIAGLAIAKAQQVATFRAGALELGVDAKGYVESVMIGPGKNLVPSGQASPLLSLRIQGQIATPTAANWNGKILSLTYPGHTAEVRVVTHPTYFSLELVKVSPAKDVELVVWGPYATSLQEQVGETIGVVQGQGTAFGLQILNAKTLGGYPNTEDDVEPSYSIFDTNDVVDLSAKDAAKELYRGDTAKRTDFGSVVQAFTRDRSKTRIIANWAHPFYTAPAFKDGGVVGSKIALFGCPSAQALPTIGEIELGEGLPHPMIDGVWGKVSPTATESYLVMGFDAKNLDECLALTKEAGLSYLYSDSCFETWGHFKLNSKGFPKNWESMKECVARAKEQGIRLGVHTLSNFITTNDPYVTPKPDRRLAEVGASKLVSALNTTQTEITIEDPKFFNEMANNNLRTVRVDDELIQYTSVSTEQPWRLEKCKRGMFNTKVASHKAGATIAKLMDHGYGTFLTNASLSQEVARNIASLFNKTGLMQLSMDGLEGNWSTGMGQYGRAIFAKAWYDALSPLLKGQVINDASNPGAYNWHINTRENWGEPWYAGFRKSQTLYRLQNQHYFKRNLMPGMLGWFQLTNETTLEDIQWLLARAAGFDAGFCITTGLDAIHQNPNSHEILAAVKAWESARHAGAFTDQEKKELQDIQREYDLVQVGPTHWALTQMYSGKFALASGASTISMAFSAYKQGAKLIIQVPDKVKLSDWSFQLDGKPLKLDWPAEISGYRYLTIDFSGLSTTAHHLNFTGKVTGVAGAKLDCELRFPLTRPTVLRPLALARKKKG